MINQNNCLFLIIDIQDKLVASVKNCDIVTKAAKLVKAADILKIPVILSEQYPKGLGNTVIPIVSVLPDNTYKFEKTFFSLLKEEGFLSKLKSYNKKQIIVCGIEAHICVHQTVEDLIFEGFDVVVAKDICASRNAYEFEIGIDCMRNNGAKISCLESILFELLRGSKHPDFKEIQSLIK